MLFIKIGCSSIKLNHRVTNELTGEVLIEVMRWYLRKV